MNLIRFIGKFRKGLDVVNLKAKPSYSQVGEDLIINFLFNSIKIQHPTYLEIGSNEPVVGNNTYFFYTQGSKGVCIEPNTNLFEKIKKTRPKDTVLNIGIGINNIEAAEFFSFPSYLHGWSTFSKEEALIREKEANVKSKVVLIPLRNINQIIETHFDRCPNFISIDVEGLDLEILESLDFKRFKPEVICVETISFSITNKEKKMQDIINFVHSQGYFTYADTHVNTIFCKKELFTFE